MSVNLYMCYLIVIEKNRFWKKANPNSFPF